MGAGILYVDDDEANLIVFTAACGRELPCYTARGGEEALELMRHHEIGVLLTDQRMPGMSGVELAEKVQSEHGIRVRPMRRRQLRKDLDAFAEVYNSAWSKNWDFVPYSKKDLDAYAQELQLVFDKHDSTAPFSSLNEARPWL